VHRTRIDLENLEARTLLSLLLGDGGRRVVRFDDARGDLVSIRLRGPGSAVVTLHNNAVTHANLQSVVVQGTNSSSQLRVRVQGRTFRPLLTGSIDIGPGGLGALVVRGTLAASVFSLGPFETFEAGAVRGAVIKSASDIGQVRVAGSVSEATILAGLDMVGGPLSDGNSAPESGRIGRVEIGGRLFDATLAAGVSPGVDGRFGTPDDIPADGTTPSTIGTVMVGGRILAGYAPGAGVVIAAADCTPMVYEHGVRFDGAGGVHVLGPIPLPLPRPGSVGEITSPPSTPPASVGPTAPPLSTPPGAPAPITPPPTSSPVTLDPIDRKQLVDVSNETQVHYGGIFNNIRAHESTVNVQVTNTSDKLIPTPVILVIESISDPTVTVANADGIVTPDGHSFFNLTGQVPGSTLDPSEMTSNRPLIFNNPLLHTFTITTSVNNEKTSPATPTVTLSVPADSQGRRLIGIAGSPVASPTIPPGSVLTVSASGTAPVTVTLGQMAAGAGSRGLVYFGATGTATTATVTTSGGASNVAKIPLRGDPSAPSAYQGDIDLTASIGGTPAATPLSVTVFRIAPDSQESVLVNDAEVVRTVTTTPAISGLDLFFYSIRGTIVGNQIAAPFVNVPSAINVIPLNGPIVQTDSHGIAQFALQQGIDGEGLTAIVISADSPSVSGGAGNTETSAASGESTCCCDCPSPASSATGSNPVQLFSGAELLSSADLTIPGRGFDFAFTRTYNSQASQLEAIATSVLGVDWGFSYSDDRLLPDGKNVILFSPTVRTDTFLATSTPGIYTAPMGLFDQLTINSAGDFVLRDSSGMIKTYARFSDPNIPGRLLSEEDSAGDLMTFHYAQINPNGVPGDQESVLSYAIDTLGREIRFQYYASTSQTVDGRVVTITEPHGNVASFGRLAHVIDFYGDMTYNGANASLPFPGQTSNRTLTFTYDSEGNLVSETSPAVTGTPDGNDFPGGKTTRYDYLRESDIPASIAGVDRERLLHDLTGIEAPNEAAFDPATTAALKNPQETFTYGMNPADRAAFDRVIAVRQGGTNINGVPAGGTIRYSYQIVGSDARTTNDPYLQTTVTDGNGNVSQYVYSPYDTLLTQTVFTGDFRKNQPASYITRYRYDNDKMLIQEIMPDGNTTTYIHDHLNPDRFQQDNLLRTIQARDAARGGDQTKITAALVYEPIYQHRALVTDPRGLDPSFVPTVPDPSGRTQLERYSTQYFFDYQESTEKAANAPDDRIDKDATGGRVNRSPLIAVDPNVLTVEIWLVQILQLPETAAGLATLRSRLASNGIQLGLGNPNGASDTTPQVAGKVVKIVQPSVVLLPSSNEAKVEGSQLQPIVTLMQYNQFGQLTKMIDPEGNVTDYTYYSEQNPGGNGVPTPPPADGRTLDPTTGGYRSEIAVDTTSNPDRDSGTNPTPADITTKYTYDDAGNILTATDGRGVQTDYFVNELNQVVQTNSAAALPASGPGHASEPLPLTAFAYLQRSFYDYNNNAVITEVEDRGNTSNVDGNPPAADLPSWVPGASNPDPVGGTAYVDRVYQYDIMDQKIAMIHEVSNGANPDFLTTLYRYDPDGNGVLTVQPEGNATASVYDERNLRFQTTAGAISPPPKALLSQSDPTSYNLRGGLPATTTDNYDPNGNLIETVDADDTDGSTANSSKIAGVGDRTRYVYDGFDRLTAVIDSVGDETVTQYDPAGNVVRTTQFGPVGGPSPTSDGPSVLPGPVSSLGVIQSANLVNSNLLAATETSYDELNRAFQTARVLFVNTIPTVRTPDVAEGGSDVGLGDLNPGQTQAIPGLSGVTILGRVTDRSEYDRNSRQTFTADDAGETSRTFYDGANRAIKTVDPGGNTVETAYDQENNIIETRETDAPQLSGVASEVFLTTYFYDSLGRTQQTVDNLGQTTYYRYDSRDNLVAIADAEGPLSGQSIVRRVFPDGPRTVDATNNFGNVTLYFYDGGNRPTRTERILTASGSGDGTHIGASIYGAKSDPTAPESFAPAAEPSQGGGDGIIRTGTIWDGDSLTSALIDDHGNVTLYLYDDLNRQVLQSGGLVVGSTYTEANILGSRVIPTPTAATINNPATIPDATINAQLTEEQDRIAAVAPLFPSLADRVDDTPPTTTITGYDPDGNILIMQDQNGSETFTKCDAKDRPIAVRVFRAGQSDSFAGDPIFAPSPVSIQAVTRNSTVVEGTTIQNDQYDGLSRKTYAFDNNDPTTPADNSTVTDGYDSLGRIIEEAQTIGGQPTQVISSAWRADNLRSALTYPNSRVEVYTYDHLDRLKTVSDQGAAQPIAIYDYIGILRVLERLYPQNRIVETYLDNTGTVDVGYDGDRRPIEVRDLRPDNSLVVGYTYSYDRMNNKRTEGMLHAPDDSETFGYDSAYRLITFDRTPGGIAPVQSNWAQDGVGNWEQVNGQAQQFSSTNELIQSAAAAGGPATVLSDDNGNETDDGTYQFQYDFRNRLVRVIRKSDGITVGAYAYDANDGRILQKTTDGTIAYALDGWQDIEERDSSGHLLRQYVYGPSTDEPLVADQDLDGDGSATGFGDRRLFYHQDAQQSVMALTDATDKVVEGYLYDAYGFVTVFDPGGDGNVDFGGDDLITPGGSSAFGNPFLFTGQRLDSETGLYDFRMREYDPIQGRFIQRDPLGCGDGMNLYQAYFVPNGTDAVGTQWEPSLDPGYATKPQYPNAPIDPWGGVPPWDGNPAGLTDGRAGYKVHIRFAVPPAPPGSTQVWQTNHVHWYSLDRNCQEHSGDSYLNDYVIIAGRQFIGDTLSTSDPGDYCIYTETVEKHQGFNPPGQIRHGTSVAVSEAVYNQTDQILVGPRGNLTYSYVYINPANCNCCCLTHNLEYYCEFLKEQGKSEELDMPGVGDFKATF
jgi:RHS repeat-associated protein